ncbi:hypothetical protein JOB18_037236 [Solea senegalensis]|uniref:Uncharacterized protein n=1 Tax=Solea senegalensis TaxID=28829 RepID=A0AAV6SBS7_SOLSE|nr:hypothetical protein JOB18_037236 [Solea senegalensis]
MSGFVAVRALRRLLQTAACSPLHWRCLLEARSALPQLPSLPPPSSPPSVSTLSSHQTVFPQSDFFFFTTHISSIHGLHFLFLKHFLASVLFKKKGDKINDERL